MEAQTKPGRPFDLWLLDIALTALSFYLAYQVRAAVDLRGHAVMPLRVYLPTLFIMLPVSAILLPLFRVYSPLTADPFNVFWRLAKAIVVATLTTGGCRFHHCSHAAAGISRFKPVAFGAHCRDQRIFSGFLPAAAPPQTPLPGWQRRIRRVTTVDARLKL